MKVFQLRKSWTLLVLAVGLLLPWYGERAALAEETQGAWETDFDQALKTAKETGKDLLVDFSGSDWCIWCQRLDSEVFSHDEFLNQAKQKYVLVVLDFPKKKTVPNREENQKLMKKFDVQGFPTVLLLDPQGEPIARTGYLDGGSDPEKYLKHLQELKTVHEGVQKRIEEVKQAGEGEEGAALSGFLSYADELHAKDLDFAQNFSLAFPDFADTITKAIEKTQDDSGDVKERAALFLLHTGEANDTVLNLLKASDPDNEKGYLEQVLLEQLANMDPTEPAGATEVIRMVNEFQTQHAFKETENAARAHFMAGYAAWKGLNEKQQAIDFLEKAAAEAPAGSRLAQNAGKVLELIRAES